MPTLTPTEAKELLTYLDSFADSKKFSENPTLYYIRLKLDGQESSGLAKQPKPQQGDIDVADVVIQHIRERNEVGKEKYGLVLQTNNGRSFLLDLYQELLDATQYICGKLLEDTGEIDVINEPIITPEDLAFLHAILNTAEIFTDVGWKNEFPKTTINFQLETSTEEKLDLMNKIKQLRIKLSVNLNHYLGGK